MDRVVALDRALNGRVIPLLARTWDEAKKQNDPTRLSEDEHRTFDYVGLVAPEITAQIGGVLKTTRPPGAQIDLSSTYFQDGDWKGIDFDGANLDGLYLYRIDLEDAELKGVTQFEGAYFYNTDWWKVKSINKPLLEYLRTKFPFNPGETYGPREKISSLQDYAAAIKGLTSQLK